MHYELIYDGISLSPQGSYTAKGGTDDISSSPNNSGCTLNFILPAAAASGTYTWELRADLDGCSANLVKPVPAAIPIASGAIVIQPGFARPLRIGVMEIQMDGLTAVPRCAPTARAKAIQRIRNDLILLLPLQDREVEIVDLGPYRFTGGLISSWASRTDLGRANQVTSELEWFVGTYNSTATEPLDFVVGVAPLNALGGADGLSMALRRRVVLVDETSPDAALHELGHSMGLHLRKEQYAGAYGYNGSGFIIPGRGLELAAMSAFNSSGKPSSVVSNGQIRHFPACLRNSTYDIMGARNPQWISAGTHHGMTAWLKKRLGLVEPASPVAPSAIEIHSIPIAQETPGSSPRRLDNDDGAGTRTVHVAALISRGSMGDQMIAPSIRIEEVACPLVDDEAFYSLNFQFESYDNTGTRLTAEGCKTSIGDLVTNTFWQQMFTIPRAAVRYRMVQTPSAQQNGFTEIWSYLSTASTFVTVGPLTTINLGLAPHDVRVFPVADATATRTIAYGTENLVAVTLRHQGVTNRVQLLIYLTPPGESELLLQDEELDLGPFEVVERNVELPAASRGTYQLRVAFHSLDLPETDPDDNQVILTMTNEPPRVDGTRVSVLAEQLPLRIPLTAWDPNGDPLSFQLEPSSGADLEGQELVFNNGGATGSYDLVVTASDGELSSASAVVTVDVYTDQSPALPPQITSSDYHQVTRGDWIELWIIAENGPCTFTSPDLPWSLNLAPQGLLTGEMPAAGWYTFTVQAENQTGTATQTITLEVSEMANATGDAFDEAVLLTGAPLTFQTSTTGAGLEAGEPNHAGYGTISSVWWRWTAPATGVVGIAWQAEFTPAAMAVYTGSSLANLTEVAAVSGFNRLLGFPAVTGQEYLVALGSFGAGEFTMTLNYLATPILRTPDHVVARQFTPFELQLETWNRCNSFVADSLPAGLTLDPVTGRLTGTPTGHGFLNLLLTLSNVAGSSADALTFEVRPASAPVITSSLRATARVGEPFLYTMQVEQASPESLFAGPLPEGLELVGSTISGIPQAAGTFVIHLSASSPSGDYVSERLALLVRPSYAAWLATQGFSAAEQIDPLITGPNADPDEDGVINHAEYLAGTNPRDPGDLLKTTVRSEDAGLLLDWPRKPGYPYQVHRGETLAEPFQLLGPTGTPPIRVQPLRTGSASEFYRVSVPE